MVSGPRVHHQYRLLSIVAMTVTVCPSARQLEVRVSGYSGTQPISEFHAENLKSLCHAADRSRPGPSNCLLLPYYCRTEHSICRSARRVNDYSCQNQATCQWVWAPQVSDRSCLSWCLTAVRLLTAVFNIAEPICKSECSASRQVLSTTGKLPVSESPGLTNFRLLSLW